MLDCLDPLLEGLLGVVAENWNPPLLEYVARVDPLVYEVDGAAKPLPRLRARRGEHGPPGSPEARRGGC